MKIQLTVLFDEHQQPHAAPAESIPVMIDAVRDVDGTSMARCLYFIIGLDEMMEGLTVEQASARVPVALVGMVGVVHRPPGESARFRSADDIDAVFRMIEATPGFAVEIEDFWLPQSLLVSSDQHGRTDRGDVFRIGTKLFSAAYRFRRERITMDEFFRIVELEARTVERSAVEAAAFAAWNDRQVDAARTYYYEHEDRALGWKE